MNNSVGPFDTDPSVAARVRVFDASIEQLLWPRSARDSVLGDKILGTIDRTTQRSSVTIPIGFLPEQLRAGAERACGAALAPRCCPAWWTRPAASCSARSPKGVPVGLIANLKLRPENGDQVLVHAKDAAEFVSKLQVDLATAPVNASDDDLIRRFANLKEPMLELSKCPDFVVNRGHYFGTAEFHHQQGPERGRARLRHGARTQRRRQARAHRLRRDVLTMLRANRRPLQR